MARVRIGLTCAAGHFNGIGWLHEPVTDKEIDKLAERARLPVECEQVAGRSLANCGRPFVGLPHVEGREREAEKLARVGGKNVPSPLRTSSKPRPREGPLTPLEWKQRTWDRQREKPGGPALCAVTNEPLSWAVDEVHHPLEKRLLRARGLHRHVWDERNSMAVKKRIHDDHTSGSERIPRECLPPGVWDFARSLGEYADWAVQRLEEDHPVTEGVPT